METTRPSENQNILLDAIGLLYSDLTELWNLETIGIKDPAEVKTKENLDNETIKLFRGNIKVIKGNKYEVCLLWKDCHRFLVYNKDKAEKRFLANTRKLQIMGYFEEYDDTTKKSWQEEGIIEFQIIVRLIKQ